LAGVRLTFFNIRFRLARQIFLLYRQVTLDDQDEMGLSIRFRKYMTGPYNLFILFEGD
jgi:hypothetical protein